MIFLSDLSFYLILICFFFIFLSSTCYNLWLFVSLFVDFCVNNLDDHTVSIR